MNILKITAFLVPLLLSACCPEQSSQMNSQNKVNVTPTPPGGGEQAIQINKSFVTAEINELFYKDDQNFIIKANILDVKEDPAYPSIAVIGSILLLTPNFQLDSSMEVMDDSEMNKNLSSLAKLKKGDKFNAEIFFDQGKGWYIQEISSR